MSRGSWLPDDALARGDLPDVVHQTMAAELVVLADGWERGVRLVQLTSDRLSLQVVVDRALDISSARIDGIPVAWRSPVPVAGPWYAEQHGYGTQRGFFGGLLTIGGLDHVGPPSSDATDRFGYPPRSEQTFPLHGRLSASPARLLGYGVTAGETPTAWVEGEVEQVSAFGEHLVLRRRVELTWGSTQIVVDDTVTNRGYAATPVELLYHVNAGWPVVHPGSRVTVLGEPSPLGPVAAPDPHSLEAVRHVTVPEGADGVADVEGVLGDGSRLGLSVHWNPVDLPAIVEWRVVKGGTHVAVGLEPTTRVPAGEPERFPPLQPGQSRTGGVRIVLRRVGAR